MKEIISGEFAPGCLPSYRLFSCQYYGQYRSAAWYGQLFQFHIVHPVEYSFSMLFCSSFLLSHISASLCSGTCCPSLRIKASASDFSHATVKYCFIAALALRCGQLNLRLFTRHQGFGEKNALLNLNISIYLPIYVVRKGVL